MRLLLTVGPLVQDALTYEQLSHEINGLHQFRESCFSDQDVVWRCASHNLDIVHAEVVTRREMVPERVDRVRITHFRAQGQPE